MLDHFSPPNQKSMQFMGDLLELRCLTQEAVTEHLFGSVMEEPSQRQVQLTIHWLLNR